MRFARRHTSFPPVVANHLFAAALVSATLSMACEQKPPAKHYLLHGQVLAVSAERQEITIKHEDIPDLMPAMTMTYPVSKPSLLGGRSVGELITATLEMQDTTGRLTEISHVGTAPLPAGNQAALAGGILAVGDPVPDAALIDETDRRRSFSEWRGTLTLVTFIYTNCPLPNYCPLMDQNFSTIQRAVAEDRVLKGRVRLVSVTFDATRDTPATLAAHAAKRKADPAVWTFLTGDAVTINRFTAAFGVGVIPAGTSAEINHNLRTTLVGPDGRVLKIYSGNDWTPGTVLADLRAAIAAS